MDNIFGLDSTIIVQALKRGIQINSEGEFVDQIGVLSLVWHPQIQRFVLVFGTTAENAAFVLLEDYDRLWKVK